MQSNNKIVNFVLRSIKDNLENVELFVDDVSKRNFISFQTEEEYTSFFQNYIGLMYKNMVYNDVESLISYTGINFRRINSILRGTWSYELNGKLTDELKEDIEFVISKIREIIKKMPNINDNIKVYRGIPLSSFKDYKIYSIEDLINLKNQYYYEMGFTSTSLIRDKSFFDRNLEYHEKCDVEIEFLIPKECSEGIPLINKHLSFSSEEEYEFLLDSHSLSKIIDVRISEDKKKAYLKAVFIPKKIYDKAYREENNKSL